MIHSQDLERQLLSGLLNHPDRLAEIRSFISKEDFYSKDSKVHQTIFLIIDNLVDNKSKVDEIVVAERIKQLGVKFEDDVSITDYIQSLAFKKVMPEMIVSVAKELKKFTVRREVYETARSLAAKMKQVDPSASFDEILSGADKIYNGNLDRIDRLGDDQASNIYDKMMEVVEERGENPVTSFGLPMPHKKLESMYGSMLRPGNITVIIARAKGGKTTFMMDLCLKCHLLTGVPVIHFDMGEMSEEELIFRQCAAMSGVPAHYLETGKWRKNQEMVDKVRAVWPKLKKNAKGESELKHYYFSVAGMSADEQVSMLKRTYYSKVGRGKEAIFLYDYIKTTGMDVSKMSEHALVGEILDKYKKCIQKDILNGNKPVISMVTAGQANRTGIVSNRKSENVVEDESVVGLSDRISMFASSVYLLRKKTLDELVSEKNKFGTHKLISLVARHLGEDIAGACDLVMVDDQPRNNFLNFNIDNFLVEEKGDLRDIVNEIGNAAVNLIDENDEDSGLPENLR